MSLEKFEAAFSKRPQSGDQIGATNPPGGNRPGSLVPAARTDGGSASIADGPIVLHERKVAQIDDTVRSVRDDLVIAPESAIRVDPVRDTSDADVQFQRVELLLYDRFNYPDGLITNEYGYANPNDPASRRSTIWDVTSGSLFASNGRGYSGVPDAGTGGVPADSIACNGSSVFRAITRRADFLNVSVRFDLVNERIVRTGRNEKAWNGVHVFLRRQDEDFTYYADVNRVDNRLSIKRKLGHGRYVTLSELKLFSVPYGAVQRVRAEVQTLPNRTVDLSVYINGRLVQQANDSSSDLLFTPGSVGIRGDNCEFYFDNFEVFSLGDL